jgi:hypothetical protein
VQSDKSEVCVFDGVLCTDGINAFVSQDFASDEYAAHPDAAAALLALVQRAQAEDTAAAAGGKASHTGAAWAELRAALSQAEVLAAGGKGGAAKSPAELLAAVLVAVRVAGSGRTGGRGVPSAIQPSIRSALHS